MRKARTPVHDTVYYHKGGRWHPTLIGPHEVKSTLESLHRAGYHAVPGRRSIGPPEGPPRSHGRPEARFEGGRRRPRLGPHVKF